MPQKHLFVTWSVLLMDRCSHCSCQCNCKIPLGPPNRTCIVKTQQPTLWLLNPVSCVEKFELCFWHFTFFEWLVSVGWFWLALCPYIWCTCIEEQEQNKQHRITHGMKYFVILLINQESQNTGDLEGKNHFLQRAWTRWGHWLILHFHQSTKRFVKTLR